ncbi:MAG: VanZ family protein [Clostridia bacterium]|nr:VanZ family protein [Clostridia bacterium]
MKTKITILFLLFATVIINIFIFANSFDDVQESYEKSDVVTNVVESMVSEQNKVDWNLNKIIRKSAHLFEFALLGITVTLCLYLIKRCYSKRFYGLGCFYVLAIAVLDEFIQSFSDRTSSVRDVLLDFGGFIVGAFILSICVAVFRIISKRKEKKCLN